MDTSTLEPQEKQINESLLSLIVSLLIAMAKKLETGQLPMNWRMDNEIME